MADSTAASESSSDSGSVFAPDQLDNSDGESRSPRDEDLEMDDLLDESNKNASDESEINKNASDKSTQDQSPHQDIDISSAVTESTILDHDTSSNQLATNVDLCTG